MTIRWMMLMILSFAGLHAQVTVNDQVVFALAFQQKAAEYRALCYQAFNWARWSIERDLITVRTDKPRAVILDIDETVLDNSPYAARQVRNGTAFPSGWSEWVSETAAIPVPGSLEFLKWADSNGIQIFYVSNRAQKELEPTLKNLAALGFPQSTKDHIMLKTGVSSKEERRQKIAATHHIVLLMGDNLNDLAGCFESKNMEGRFAAADSLRAEFGSRLIVLPNPVYGDWEGALYDYDWGLSLDEKNKRRKKILRDK